MDFIFAQSQPVQGGGILSFLPFLLIMVILYFFMLRPQAKKQKEKQEMINNLNKGDKVITMGGIIGTVNGFKEKGKIITLKVDNNTTLTFNKSAIAGLSGKISEEDLG
ncbi:MAG: preprotein translocase subunit YajC [Candidatus Marinimicrobia bacterium]|nr:preprotein translocase subunit YajC [Candidatus Neomarinimicrobiota bacterium]|tara:strand:- start:303 stop:626 length:324 start_codon:yes stop_codon:yes gene_type:complete